MRALRSSAARQRGAAALEFALVAPVIILMMLGMIDFGLAMNAEAVVANAARDGARRASLGADANASKDAASASASALTNYGSWSSASPNPTVSVDCFKLVDTSIPSYNFTTPCVAGSDYNTTRAAHKTSGEVVRVTVTYTYSYITPLPAWIGFGSTAKIQKVSYMRIEGDS